MNWIDYARHRLSVFTREEAKAIVAYMTYKREHDTKLVDNGNGEYSNEKRLVNVRVNDTARLPASPPAPEGC